MKDVSMSLMADPMIALREVQEALDNGMSVDPYLLGEGYFTWSKDFPDGGKTHSYVKIINKEIQALAIFAIEEKIGGVHRYSIGYAVSKNHRGRGLAVEVVNKGIGELKQEFGRNNIRRFYVEALIDEKNIHSIKVAEKLFPNSGVPKEDSETGTPALLFYRLIDF